MIVTSVAIALLLFSLYTLFTATDALEFSGAILRVSLSVMGLVAARFTDELTVSIAVLLFAVLAVTLLVISRSEVQINHDES